MVAYCSRRLTVYFVAAIVLALVSTEVGPPLLEISIIVVLLLSFLQLPTGIVVSIVGAARKNKRMICHGLGLVLTALIVIFGGTLLRVYQQAASEKKAGRIIEALDRYAQLNSSFPQSLDEIAAIAPNYRTTEIGILKTHKYYYVPVGYYYDLFFYAPGGRVDCYHSHLGWEISSPSWRLSGKVPAFVR